MSQYTHKHTQLRFVFQFAGMVVAYSILGGFIFQALEAPNEEKVKHEVIGFKRHHVNAIFDEAVKLHNGTANRSDFEDRVQGIFVEFQEQVRVYYYFHFVCFFLTRIKYKFSPLIKVLYSFEAQPRNRYNVLINGVHAESLSSFFYPKTSFSSI